MSTIAQYILMTLLWGTTWFIAKFQVGVVDPLVSVSYRFIVASLVLLSIASIKRVPLKATRREHTLLLFMGATTFAINYVLIYIALKYIPSGMVAILFSTAVFWCAINSALFLKHPLQKQVLFGGLIGYVGVLVISHDIIESVEFSRDTLIGIVVTLLSTYIASLGSITSEYLVRTSKKSMLLINGLGMLYGGLFLLVVSLLTKRDLMIDFSLAYIGSFIYLAVIGTAFGFTIYLSLIHKIGSPKASTILLITPLTALVISFFMREYQITPYLFLGSLFITIGNLFSLQKLFIKE